MASSFPVVLFRRLHDAERCLARDAPLAFQRMLPTGDAVRHTAGVCVEVRIHPDLRIFVLTQPERDIALSGRFARGEVCWDQAPSALLPITAQGMLAADVRDMLRLFRLREIHPKAWTSRTDAQEEL